VDTTDHRRPRRQRLQLDQRVRAAVAHDLGRFHAPDPKELGAASDDVVRLDLLTERNARSVAIWKEEVVPWQAGSPLSAPVGHSLEAHLLSLSGPVCTFSAQDATRWS
jgi:hypothetical protein